MGLGSGRGFRRIAILLVCGVMVLVGLQLATTALRSGHEAQVLAAGQTPAVQGAHTAGHANLGEVLPLWSCFPFVGMLLSIAFMPLIAPQFWHHHFGKISAFWAGLLGVPFLIAFKGTATHEILHILLADYVPFIILLWSLYTVSGGILLRGTLQGTPVVNTLLLMVGAVMASWMGTTGAAMLLIRPLLNANRHRKNRTFMVVFFIFLVANIGGALTPLGDPPLFLGYLHGVPFFWTFKILPHMLIMAAILLIFYFGLDSYHYRKEGIAQSPPAGTNIPLKLEGLVNIVILAGVVLAVLMSGIFDWGEISILGVHRAVQDWVRDLLLIALGSLSLAVTPTQLREDNNFSWFPIIEVAYLFIGIFVTMIPCLLILKAGAHGALAFVVTGVEKPLHYFWVTGVLSGFLDNAPTYLTFFNTALGSFYPSMPEAQAVALLTTENAIYLKAIASGAVFFGAFSYIGNAPNFMVRSISEELGTPMPSFFGYIIKYALVFLVPCLVVVTLVMF
ncbi:MAG: sodium:proton antiporter [Desulfobacterales bacterium]|nr:sodium:proton antiporter [Desulfobacterales bacterium]